LSKSFDLKIVTEIAIVFAVVLSVKEIADNMAITGAGSIAMWCGIITATVFLKRYGASWRSVGLTLPVGVREWVVTLGLALTAVVSVIVFMVFILAPMTAYFGWVNPPDAPDRWVFLLGRPWLFFAYLVGVVWIGAALGEELLMRGFVLNRLADLFGHSRMGWALAVIVHAIFFGLLHVYQGVPGIVGSGVAALIFASIYLLGKRRLLPVIIGHGIINTISLSAYYLSDGKMT
jgi:membrane protease YdiL (CAAX protease family)